jgi:NDP-sugar pyrophosphorylase family protein
MYALRRDSLRAFIAPGKPLDMPDLLLSLIRAGHEVRAWQTDCLWLDIGRPDEYARAQALAEGASDGQQVTSGHHADPGAGIR